MTEKRYTIRLGKNNEFKEIIDHCKGDKHISVFDFLKQVNEQDKAFKKLKEENKKLQDFKDLWIGENSILKQINKALIESNQELTRRLSAIKIEKINEIIEQNKKHKQENERLNKRISIYKEDYSETLNDLQRAEKNIEYGIHRVAVLEKENKELKQLVKKVIDERFVDYPLLCKLKEMVEE